ncbi:MAG: hypothetical protein IPP79_09785 [Chitinophagaceae bacterium]|nr:hypothetical protein [Chitinophagaceae bacterium]
MSYATSLDANAIREWMMAKLEPHAIEEQLKAKGLDPESILAHIKEYKKQCCAKRQFTGFIWLGIGAFLGFISCLLSVTNPFPEYYYHILYGLTSIALIMIFVGLYYIFE